MLTGVIIMEDSLQENSRTSREVFNSITIPADTIICKRCWKEKNPNYFKEYRKRKKKNGRGTN